MITGKIYKYTNVKNGKIYIGQTLRPIEIRDLRHQKDAKDDSDLCFHRALRKYGRENFELEIIEDNIEKELLDEKEKYWIKFYNSHYLNGQGYNMTDGGQWGNAPRKLSDDEINEIQNLLLNNKELSITDIAKEFNVSVSCVSDINRGRTWKQNHLQYPLRDNLSDLRYLTKDIHDKVLNDLKNTYLSQIDIAKKYNINISIVSEINTGSNIFKNENETYPIRAGHYMTQTKISLSQLYQLLEDYLSLNLKRKDLCEKYKITECYLKGIIGGYIFKRQTKDLIFPLKQNKEKNLKILSKLKNN